jgi:aryl-alcohol dehydrogenase-like predicted oxidoreductase
METVALGRCGLRVSRLCLGTMLFGSQVDEAASVRIMDAALDLGIDFVDTADAYPVPQDPATAGRSEEIVGRWLADKRGRVVIATKCVSRVGRGPNDAGGSRKHVIEACERSLRRLRTDRIDLYYLHHSDLGAPMEETFAALDHLVHQGKVLYVGVSNFEAWHMALAFRAVAEHRLAPIVAHQPRYNLLHRPFERDLLPLCRAAGLGVMPYNPLGGGMLTGRYRRGEPPPEGSRFAWGDYGRMYQGRYWSERMFDVAEAVAAVARAEGGTPAQVALAWLLGKEGVTAPIVGASRGEQLQDCAAAVGRRLSDEARTRLDAVSAAFV